MSEVGPPLSGRVLKLGSRVRNLHYQAALMAGFLAAPHVVAIVRNTADGWDWLLGIVWVLFAIGSLIHAQALRARIDRGDWVGVLHDA